MKKYFDYIKKTFLKDRGEVQPGQWNWDAAWNVASDSALFFSEFLRHPGDIGALIPSSSHLAQAMTKFVYPSKTAQGKCYLEAGGGTGAFTQAIIDKLTSEDHLDVIEINPLFGERLKKKYSHLPNVSIQIGSILDWTPSCRYDAIISSLPFNAFRPNHVKEILDHYQNIRLPGGHLSYCEYIGFPKVKMLIYSRRARKDLKNTQKITQEFQDKFQIGLDQIYSNFPPALVHHCQFPE